ncbi:hypothetical protein IAT38_007011 [Cryptococcus sp. DSM 104549]
MTTPNRSRKSSAASSFLRPPSLRIPSNPRPQSNTAVSLVFAQGGASRSAALSEQSLSRQLDGDLGGKQMGLRSRRSSNATVRTTRTASGLASPRSPSPSFGVQEEDEEGIPEVNADGRGRRRESSPQPGPSSAPFSPLAAPREPARSSTESVPVAKRQLNPKSSSSWLRWTSPAPSFPRSSSAGSKGKGKAKERGADWNGSSEEQVVRTESPEPTNQPLQPGEAAIPGHGAPSTTSPPVAPVSGSTHSSSPDHPHPSTPPAPPASSLPSSSTPPPETTAAPPATAHQPPVSEDTTVHAQQAQSWWARSFSRATKAPGPERAAAAPDTGADSDSAKAAPAPADVTTGVEASGTQPPAIVEVHTPASVDIAASQEHGQQGQVQQEQKQHEGNEPGRASLDVPRGDTGSTRTWKGYLGLAKDGKQGLEQPSSREDTTRSLAATPVESAGGSAMPSELAPAASPTPSTQPTSHPPSPPLRRAPQPTVDAPTVDDDETPRQADHTSNWSSYFYSFVVPEPKQRRSIPSPSNATHSTTTEVEPTAPADDQKPVPAQPTLSQAVPHNPAPHTNPAPSTNTSTLAAPHPDAATATNQSSTGTVSSRSASPSRQPGSVSSRRSSAAGWLSYLAFRASQKKISAGSVDTGSSEAGETMDFSADPEFPAAQEGTPHGLMPPPQTLGGGGSSSGGKGKEVRLAESVKSVTPRASQNLDVRKKRLSNASTISAGSISPFPASPKARSSLEQPGTSPSKGGATTSGGGGVAGSALPHPQAPATQPNLVIPTFANTFDRPPRSFLPLPTPATLPDAVNPSGKGITATTTGFAWRALGAVGSYVYGDTAPKPTPESIPEDATETRGRKEGRTIGRELPRRIGLGAGTPDDGWKTVRRVVVVGVHGWFPAKMLNSVIGEPTGTSVKFANMMGQAVKQFFQEKGVDDIRLTLMPLEGEGTIDSRVDRLYKAYLSNPAWINDLRRADAIFFAAHSQGCIVTTHLISRMIAQGHIRTAHNAEAVSRCEWAFGPIAVVPPEEPRRGGRRHFSTHISGSEGGRQKVAMLAMCGVHLGPLYSISTSSVIQPYLQWFENAAARELFEFQDTGSAVSQAYQRALSMVLENEVRVVLLASLNDQVVPIYGSSFSAATHPLLLRALYVDGASYTQSDFMTNLLCFAFMLRNAGIDDQRLVEHLSEATAGSLTGVGHSTPYEELSCYSLAVQYLFYAGPVQHPIPPLQIESFTARDARNDFELPWIMRALVDSPEVKDLFPGELRDLKEGILHWKPVTKPLREIKRRLEPMAGRQSRLRPLPSSPSSASLASNGAADQLGASPGASKNLVAGLRRDW